MGFRICLLFIMALLPVTNAQLTMTIDDSCLVRPKYGPPGHGRARRSPCVNCDVLRPELINLNNSLPQSIAELGLSDVVTDVEELCDYDLIQFRGPIGPIGSGGGRRRRRAATHWSRVGRVTNLVYNVTHHVNATLGDREQFFAFDFPALDSLDPLEGPLQSLLQTLEEFRDRPEYTATNAEAMPSLVEEFQSMLDSFNCSNSGPNCGLTRGEDSVVQLDEYWSVVQRFGFEYDPAAGGTRRRRAIRFRFAIGIPSWRGFRIFIIIRIY
ncbi:uncharacterized protein [Branchiostoma lanceolatum]|uniref:uncharacterized protein n=1 Tax=Branchiostoma lanceolatum TaxID=7740 RepID=UPI003453CB53